MNQSLTERERQVMWCVAEGMSNRSIGLNLEIAESTVKAHIHKILSKLHLTTRTQIAMHAVRTEATPCSQP